MRHFVLQKRGRIKPFFLDAGKGFRLMWSFAKKLTIALVILYVIQAILPLLGLLLLKRFIDDATFYNTISWSHSGLIILLFFAVQVANVITTELSAYYQTLQEQMISNGLVTKVLKKAIELDLEYFENPAFYDQMHMAQQQSEYRPAQLIGALQGLLQSTITILLFSGFLLSIHWFIPILLIFLSVPLAIVKLVQGYQQYLLNRDCTPLERQASELFEYLTHYDFAKELRVFSYGPLFIEKFVRLKSDIFVKSRNLNRAFLKYNVWIQVAEIVTIILIYGLIIQRTLIGAVTVGGLVVYLTSFQRLQASINSFYQSAINLFHQQLYLNVVLKYISLPPVQSRGPAVAMPALGAGITIKDLSFTYPNTGKEILHKVNMHFPASKIVAIVGENGSGKSTLVKLLCRLYEVAPETISFADTDINNIETEELRHHITVLFQDFGKYYLTIQENISLGHPHTQDKLTEAARKSGFNRYLPGFPLGFDTPLGRSYRGGEQLSGGQWQKLALSRTFFKNSRILILDEPTSALDPSSEHAFFENIKRNIEGRIIILISHRLSNLRMADHIYLLQNGSIAESGSFQQLLQKQGIFYETYKMQIQ